MIPLTFPTIARLTVSLPVSITEGILITLLQQSQINIQYLFNVVILRIWILFQLVEELLGVRSDLSGGSRPNIILYALPILTELSERLKKPFMLLSCPSALRAWVGSHCISCRMRVVIVTQVLLPLVSLHCVLAHSRI